MVWATNIKGVGWLDAAVVCSILALASFSLSKLEKRFPVWHKPSLSPSLPVYCTFGDIARKAKNWPLNYCLEHEISRIDSCTHEPESKMLLTLWLNLSVSTDLGAWTCLKPSHWMANAGIQCLGQRHLPCSTCVRYFNLAWKLTVDLDLDFP